MKLIKRIKTIFGVDKQEQIIPKAEPKPKVGSIVAFRRGNNSEASYGTVSAVKDGKAVIDTGASFFRETFILPLINKNGAICSLCDKPIETMKDCTIDHIVPISKGGLTTIENCQLAHRSCNLSKGNKEA